MHIATAGDNRIWTYNLGKRELRLLAGSGALGVSDGSGNRASFAQPVGLATVQQVLYACDAAGSAIRSVNARSGQVTTLLGQDTWNFGKADGARVERSEEHTSELQSLMRNSNAAYCLKKKNITH